MTIDIHNHIWTREYLSDHWWDIYANFFSTYITDSPFSGTPEEIDRNLFAKCFDPDGSDLPMDSTPSRRSNWEGSIE